MLTIPVFETYPGLCYGFSERSDGAMNLEPGASAAEIENRRRFLRTFNIPLTETVAPALKHTTAVAQVSASDRGNVIPNVDALVTGDSKVFLTATGADCFPVFFFDPKNHAVGLAHAGWRGIVGGIVPNTINAMVHNFGSDPRQILAAVGPGIQQHHFEIKADAVESFAEYPNFLLQTEGTMVVDLSGILIFQLKQAGLLAANIYVSPHCTYCEVDKYFSFRRDKPKRVEPMLSFIGMKDR